MNILQESIKTASFYTLERLVADCQQRIGSNHTDTEYVKKQQGIIDMVAVELEGRTGV